MLIDEALSLFPATEQPEHFTNYWHCDECWEHDQTLLAHTRESIDYAALGNAGWDPLCFVQGAGFRYYFPAMVRLALQGTNEAYYLDQLLFHLGREDVRGAFDQEQSAFVTRLLEWMIEHLADAFDTRQIVDSLFQTLSTWDAPTDSPA